MGYKVKDFNYMSNPEVNNLGSVECNVCDSDRKIPFIKAKDAFDLL
ncbi:hypothetical protein LCGC14_0622430 [marine sediment metagenome]|uniref:Uncharacterized protein n=1 Tax=marine sediment metagenome TaxID=412755 RepID=A0A0F9RNN0_9ZZZZ